MPEVATLVQASHERRIVLLWLSRLRWLAVAGQIVAVGVAVGGLRLELPIYPIVAIIALTAASNLPLLYWVRRDSAPSWSVSGVVVLDVLLLTALLFCTGGSNNPLAALYLVHVAIGVAVLGPRGTWAVAALVAGAYVALFWWHIPADGLKLSRRAAAIGNCIALLLDTGLIAYFGERIVKSLRQRERQVVELREQAHRNERLAALTTLAAGAAHELGTPLATIAVVAKELELASKGGASDAMAEDAKLIRQEVDRCRVIIDRMRGQIVEETRPAEGGTNALAIMQLVRRALSPAEQERLKVADVCEIELAAGPAAAVQQAMAVLVRNAFDAGDGSGEVELAVRQADGRVAFEVLDHGCGMSEDILCQAGQPFFTTKPPGKGTGLGLFLVRLVAEKYGGQLKVDSHPGSGTRCVLELPRKQVGESNEPGIHRSRREDDGGGR